MPINMRFPGGKPKTLTFSYDDGVEQDLKLINILDKHGMKGTFNLNSGCFAPEGTVYPEGQIHRRMTRAMCEKAYVNHEVAIHSLTHPFLERLSKERCTYEVMQDRLNLENLTGKIVRGMAYPYGTYSDSVVNCLESCGVAYSRTVESTCGFNLPMDWLRLPATCHHSHPDLMKLAKKFAEDIPEWSGAKMFYLWGHAYEFEADNNWNVIEEFTEYMANRDDIWYATNIEIYDYIKAFNSLMMNVEETVCTNPTSIEVWFKHKGTMYSIKPGETITL